MEETDDSYLSLLFNEQIFFDAKQGAKTPDKSKDICLYLPKSLDPIHEDSLNKCFSRLKIDPARIHKTDRISTIDQSIKTLIFSDQPVSIEGFPELKYTKTQNVIWFDNFATIAADTQLKVVFWDKFQNFFS